MNSAMKHTVSNDKHDSEFPSTPVVYCTLSTDLKIPLGRVGTSINVLLNVMQEQIYIGRGPCGIFMLVV